MANKMHFGEFNPLEVLATAASLQSVAPATESSGGDGESSDTTAGESASGNDSSESDKPNGPFVTSPDSGSSHKDSRAVAQPTSVYRIHIKSLASAGVEASTSSSGMGRNSSGSCIVKVVTRNNTQTNRAETAKDFETQNMPTVQDTKRVTVLTEDKTQSVDHSYASLGHLDRSRTEEDEGYVSRSSIDSPGQAWRSDTEALDPDGVDVKDGCINIRDMKSPVNVGLPALTMKSLASTRPPSIDITSPLSIDSETSDGLKSPSILAGESPALSPAGPVVLPQQQTPTSILYTPNKKATKIVIINKDSDTLVVPTEQHGVLEVDADVDNVIQMPDQADNVLRSLLGEAKTSRRVELKSDEISKLCNTKVSKTLTVAENMDEKTVPSLSSLCDEAESDETPGSHQNLVKVDDSSIPPIPADVMSSDSVMHSSTNVIETLDTDNPSEDASAEAVSADVNQNRMSTDSVSAAAQSLVVTTAPQMSCSVSAACITATSSSSSNIQFPQAAKPVSKRSSRGKSSLPAVHLPPVISNPARNDKMILLPLSGRNQYIIEDDVPPHAKANSHGRGSKAAIHTLVPVSRIAGVLLADRAVACQGENHDTWEVLGAVSPQGELTHTSSASHAPDTVSIPVAVQSGVSQGLCSKLVATSAPAAVLLPCSNVSQPGIKAVINQHGSSLVPQASAQLKNIGNPSGSMVPLKVTAVGLASQGKSVVMPSPLTNTVNTDHGAISMDNLPVLVTTTAGSKDTCHLQLVAPEGSVALRDTESPSNSLSNRITTTPGHNGENETVAGSQASVITDDDNEDSLLSIDGSSSDVRNLTLQEPGMRDSHEDDPDKAARLGESSDTESSQTENSETASALSMDDDYSRSGLESGRATPIGHVESSPGEKINIKISGSKVINVTGSGESSSTVKSTTSIGMVGSLSWTSLGNIANHETPEDDDTSTGDSSPVNWSISPAVSAPGMRNLLVSSETFFPCRLNKRLLKEGGNGKGEAASARTCHTYVRRRGRAASVPNMASLADLSRAKQSALLISRLHPLIDHDYCTFAEFSADIQSSIIATTETKIRNERKYAKKAKAARTKAVGCIPPVEKMGRVKRKYVRRKLLNEKKDNFENTASPPSSAPVNNNATREKLVKTDKQTRAEAIKEGKRRAMAERKAKMKAHIMRNKNDKNYVKITGSYQDEFVYFATKKTRGRPRKPVENAEGTQSKIPVGGLIDFDYYRDLSKADKSSRFGISRTHDASGSSVVPISLANESFDSLTNLKMTPNYTGPGSTPLQDSDVVDLVMDLMPSEELDVTTTCEDNHRMLNSLMSTEQSKTAKSEGTPSTVANESSINEEASMEPEDLAKMVEQVRSMITSMDPEASLKMLEKLGDSSKLQEASPTDIEESTKMKEESTLNGLNSLLSPCSAEPAQTPSLAPTQPLPGATNLLDLDDINDSDLIHSDLVSMNMILGDLSTANKSSTTWVDCKSTLASLGDGGASPMKHFADSDTEVAKEPFVASASNTAESSSLGYSFDRPLDQSELFPDLSGSGESPSTSINDSGVPELTVVSMYWNDLPGLLISTQQFVRLVDIHKQILPAKDTGILKKRAQMMGLDISNCSELQRDFLIRYANAAKSKSTVIVSKGAAQNLIGFYVDPRPRVAKARSADIKEEDEEAIEDNSTWKAGTSNKECPVSANTGHITDDKIGVGDEVITTDNNETSKKSPVARSIDQNFPESPDRHSSPSPSVHRRARKRPAAQPVGEAVISQNLASPRRLKLARHMLDVKRSARLRNKKVQYAAMLQGNYSEFENAENKTKVTKISRRSGDNSRIETTTDPQETVAGGDGTTKEDVSRQTYPEEIEIRKLRGKQKKRPLSTKDRKRLKQLRERLRKRLMKSKIQDEKIKKIAKVKLKKKKVPTATLR